MGKGVGGWKGGRRKKEKNKKTTRVSCKHCAWGDWLQMEVINENSNTLSHMYSVNTEFLVNVTFLLVKLCLLNTSLKHIMYAKVLFDGLQSMVYSLDCYWNMVIFWLLNVDAEYIVKSRRMFSPAQREQKWNDWAGYEGKTMLAWTRMQDCTYFLCSSVLLLLTTSILILLMRRM